jgi:hypothetical protein
VLVPVDREAGVAAQHEVNLLMAELVLGVLLDDRPADLTGGVGVHAEGVDPEAAADRPPDEPVGQLDPFELVDVRVDRGLRAHLTSSGQRGSVCRATKSLSSRA